MWVISERARPRQGCHRRLSFFVSNLSVTLGKSRALAVPKITTAILAIGLNAAAASVFGVIGVLVAGFLFSAVYTLAIILIFSRSMPAGLVWHGFENPLRR